jgi:hypothetical protein
MKAISINQTTASGDSFRKLFYIGYEIRPLTADVEKGIIYAEEMKEKQHENIQEY